jgi:hypothetical protein
MVRVWTLVRAEPSVRIVQMRSTRCQGPSWQNITRVGSVGENWAWPSHLSDLWTTLRAPVFRSSVKISIGVGVSKRSVIRTPLALAKDSGLPSGPLAAYSAWPKRLRSSAVLGCSGLPP